MKTETRSPVLRAVEDGHYEKHDEGLCYEDGEKWPCKVMKNARREAAHLPVKLQSERTTQASPFRY